MRITIPRTEIYEVKKKGWVMLYGRRKVGKTFMVRHFMDYDHYFFAERGGPILHEKDGEFESISYETFRSIVHELLKQPVTIIVDEFQRLPNDFLDLLHFAKERRAKLVLLGSSMRVVKDVLSSKSPLLGLVRPVKLDLVRPLDILKVFKTVEEVVFLRDPWLLQFYEEDVMDSVRSALPSVRGLVGEIFFEEDRTLTETYEGILRALAVGNVFPKDIASYLGKPSGDIKPFLANLMEMGLVKRVKVFKKKRWIYFIRSPVVDLFYYLDTKYGISELNVAVETFKKAYRDKLPRYFESFVREMLAERYGGEEGVILSPEVDVVITVGGRVVCCAEVKMKSGNRDLRTLIEKTAGIECEKFVVDESTLQRVPSEEILNEMGRERNNH